MSQPLSASGDDEKNERFVIDGPASLLAIAALNSRLQCEDGRVTLSDDAKGKTFGKDAPRLCECMLQSTQNTSITWDAGDSNATCGVISVQTEQDSSGQTEIYIQDRLGPSPDATGLAGEVWFEICLTRLATRRVRMIPRKPLEA